MALTFQKGDGSKIYITKLTLNDSSSVRTLSVNDVEYYKGYLEFTELDDGTYSVSAKDKNNLPSTLNIPETYNGKTVTVIAVGAFDMAGKANGIKTVVIPKSVKEIKERAFAYCTKLDKLKFAEGSELTTLGYRAFASCNSLKEIDLPNKLTLVNSYAMPCLYKIILPKSIVKIPGSAFSCIPTSSVSIYYEGTLADWENVQVVSGNDNITSSLSTIYYYSETKPTTEGNYWHYVDGEIFEWDGSACENGHTWVKESCTTPMTCSVCGATKGETFEHTWGEWEITKRQNCTEAGEKTRTCSVCGEQEIEPCGTPIGHDFEGGVLVLQPTCKEVGYIEQQCSRCESIYNKEVSPLGHDWGEWVIDETTGQKTSTCLRCGAVAKMADFIFTELPDGNYSVKAKEGITGVIEIPSDYDGGKVTEIEQSGFANSEIVSVIIPSSVRKICDDAFSDCKNLKTVTMNEGVTYIGHRAFKNCSSIETIRFPDSVVYIGHQTLNGCGGIVNIVLPYIGNYDWKDESHFYEYPLGYHFGTEDYEGGAATKQEYYSFWDINDPGTLLETRTFYIPEGLRTVEVHRGNILHGAFQNCTGITKITLPSQIDKIGQNSFLNCENLEELIIPVTLQEIDYSAFEGCSNVIIQYYGDETKYRIENNCLVEVESGEIIFGNQNSEIPSSASSIGAGAFYGNTYFAPITIPLSVTNIGSLAFGGKPVTVYVEATSKPADWADDWCDDNVKVVWGYSEGGESCSHSYGGWITTALPTCTRFGSMRRTCSICGNVDIALIDPLEHEYETVVTEPTCLTKGYTDYICKRCGTQLRKDYTSSLGHEWDEGFVRIEPTCTTNGVRRHTCTRCGDTVEVGISALRHDWGEWSHVHPAECEIDGTDSRYCKRCGEEEIQNVPATGHDWDVDVEVVEPTCTDGGYTIHTCNYCGATKRDNYTEPLGHNIVNGICTRCDNDTRGVVYYGVAAIPERYNSAFVLGLDQKVPSNSHLTSISATPLEGEYIYYCVPTSFGDCSFAYNNFVGGFSLIIEGLALTNAGGKTESYNIYKSNQANLGANGEITISIIGTGG